MVVSNSGFKLSKMSILHQGQEGEAEARRLWQVAQDADGLQRPGRHLQLHRLHHVEAGVPVLPEDPGRHFSRKKNLA